MFLVSCVNNCEIWRPHVSSWSQNLNAQKAVYSGNYSHCLSFHVYWYSKKLEYFQKDFMLKYFTNDIEKCHSLKLQKIEISPCKYTIIE